jgi:hypothetical protein
MQRHVPGASHEHRSGQQKLPQGGRPSGQTHCPAWQVCSCSALQVVAQLPQKRASVRRSRQRR